MEHCFDHVQAWRALEGARRSAGRGETVQDDRQIAPPEAGIELVRDKTTKRPFDPKEKIGVRVIESARKKGAILRPLGSVIVLMPPLAIQPQEVDLLVEAVRESIVEVTGAPAIR